MLQLDFREQGTISRANFIVEAHTYGYNLYYRIIRQMLTALNPKGTVLEGRQFVADGFRGAGTPGLANVIVEIWYKAYNVYPNAIKQRPTAPNLKCT